MTTALQAINRAARSFSLYDPKNDAVTRLVADYRAKTAQLSGVAPFVLDVFPFEIRLGDAPVYQEDDRERSLAYRLFRDGVRQLRFAAGVDWPDMVLLLEALSVRATTVRQQEDDLLTLLRKADFQHIEIDAVEGYTPDEQNPEASLVHTLRPRQPTSAANEDWDQPLPEYEHGATVEARAIPAAAVARLRAEEHPSTLASQAVRGLTELLRSAQHLCDEQLARELVPFAHEVQDYLLFDQRLEELASLAKVYRQALASSKQPQLLPVLCADDCVERLVSALPDGSDDVPQAFFELLEAAPSDPTARTLALLGAGAQGNRRAALVAVLERSARAHPDRLVARLPSAEAALARDLFAVLRKADPTRALEAAFALLDHPDPDFLLELLDIVGGAPAGVRLAQALQKLMGSPHEQVRIKASDWFGRRGGARAVAPLAEHARRHAASFSPAEATGLGRALALASAEQALPLFAEWLRSAGGVRGMLSRFGKDKHSSRMLIWVALAGLELCPGDVATNLVKRSLADADPELEAFCRDVLLRRARGATPRE